MTLRHGYFSDQGYTYGAYPETSPERLAFVALLHSHRPPDLAGPSQVLELGCGQGFGLCLQAACYPQAQFVGVDFSAEHIAHGRALARRADLANIRFLHSDFAGLAAVPPSGWGAFDIVIAHGVLGWVSPDIGSTLIQLASEALRPGGLFYLSYNTLPGWLDRLPFQHAVKHFQQRLGDGQPSLDAALKLFAAQRESLAKAKPADQQPPQPLHQQHRATPPDPSRLQEPEGDGGREELVREIMNRQGCTYLEAWNTARQRKPELFVVHTPAEE
jgi:SAM-dependent methyltransferase